MKTLAKSGQKFQNTSKREPLMTKSGHAQVIFRSPGPSSHARFARDIPLLQGKRNLLVGRHWAIFLLFSISFPLSAKESIEKVTQGAGEVYVKKMNPKIYTKSAIMVGIGETDEEIIESLKDLRSIDCDLMTIGQYLRPTSWHIPLNEYVHPEKFKFYEEKALELGFKYCASGPFVRSSYKAGELYVKNCLKQGK